jgi:hypothetical protein
MISIRFLIKTKQNIYFNKNSKYERKTFELNKLIYQIQILLNYFSIFFD